MRYALCSVGRIQSHLSIERQERSQRRNGFPGLSCLALSLLSVSYAFITFSYQWISALFTTPLLPISKDPPFLPSPASQASYSLLTNMTTHSFFLLPFFFLSSFFFRLFFFFVLSLFFRTLQCRSLGFWMRARWWWEWMYLTQNQDSKETPWRQW